MVRKKLGKGRKNRCRFCTKEGCPRPAFVDYKDVQGLKKLCTSQGKLFSRKRSGNCAAPSSGRRPSPSSGPGSWPCCRTSASSGRVKNTDHTDARG